MCGVFAEFEREMIRERVKAGLENDNTSSGRDIPGSDGLAGTRYRQRSLCRLSGAVFAYLTVTTPSSNTQTRRPLALPDLCFKITRDNDEYGFSTMDFPTGPRVFDYDNPNWARQLLLQLCYNIPITYHRP